MIFLTTHVVSLQAILLVSIYAAQCLSLCIHNNSIHSVAHSVAQYVMLLVISKCNRLSRSY